jgi:hypothetical protein
MAGEIKTAGGAGGAGSGAGGGVGSAKAAPKSGGTARKPTILVFFMGGLWRPPFFGFTRRTCTSLALLCRCAHATFRPSSWPFRRTLSTHGLNLFASWLDSPRRPLHTELHQCPLCRCNQLIYRDDAYCYTNGCWCPTTHCIPVTPCPRAQVARTPKSRHCGTWASLFSSGDLWPCPQFRKRVFTGRLVRKRP